MKKHQSNIKIASCQQHLSNVVLASLKYLGTIVALQVVEQQSLQAYKSTLPHDVPGQTRKGETEVAT